MRQRTKAMIGLTAAICAYEVWCDDEETISDWYDAALESHPIPTFLGTVALAAHVLNVYENYGVEHIDPIHRVASMKPKKGSYEQ